MPPSEDRNRAEGREGPPPAAKGPGGGPGGTPLDEELLPPGLRGGRGTGGASYDEDLERVDRYLEEGSTAEALGLLAGMEGKLLPLVWALRRERAPRARLAALRDRVEAVADRCRRQRDAVAEELLSLRAQRRFMDEAEGGAGGGWLSTRA